MLSSGILWHVALVRTDVSEEHSASIIRVTRIRELGTLVVTANIVPSSLILVTLMMEALYKIVLLFMVYVNVLSTISDGIISHYMCFLFYYLIVNCFVECTGSSASVCSDISSSLY
jgi:hypothetical protein